MTRSDLPREADEMMRGSEVAALLRVDPKTVTRWAQDGRIASIRTPGGHRRYRRSDVDMVLAGLYEAPSGDVALPEPGEEEEL